MRLRPGTPCRIPPRRAQRTSLGSTVGVAMKSRFRLAAIALATALSAGTSQAQGIPVIDIANLIQTIQQVMNDITKIENQVEQIRQLQSQVASINGVRTVSYTHLRAHETPE